MEGGGRRGHNAFEVSARVHSPHGPQFTARNAAHAIKTRNIVAVRASRSALLSMSTQKTWSIGMPVVVDVNAN